jgi:prepilin-type processing-associated H-X9-DG protein
MVNEPARRSVSSRFRRSIQIEGDSSSRRRFAELAMAVVIISAVGAMILSTYTGATARARRTVCADRLRRLVQAMAMYEQDWDGQLPLAASWVHAIYPTLRKDGNVEAVICPADPGMERTYRRQRDAELSSYTYRNPSEVGLSPDATGTALLWDYLGGTDRGAHGSGGNIAFGDGHVAWLAYEHWATADSPDHALPTGDIGKGLLAAVHPGGVPRRRPVAPASANAEPDAGGGGATPRAGTP